MPNISSKLPKSIHYSLEEIAEGIFAAISTEESGAFSNAGIIDLGDRTIIFDTFETTLAAEDLRVASEFLTGKQATWVVNSHSHSDHWFGNQVFSQEATVIATHSSAELMMEYPDEVEADKSDPSELKVYLQDQISQLEHELDQNKRQMLRSSIARWKYYLESLPELSLRIPNQTFSGKMTFHGSKRSVELIDVGPAHTSSDCYLSIPSEDIAFLGDLGFFKQLPFMADCDPDGWISFLEELKASSLQIIIPGHGPIGGIQDIIYLEKYINLLNSLVKDAIKIGNTVDEVVGSELPEPYRSWSIGSSRMEINIKAMFEFHSR